MRRHSRMSIVRNRRELVTSDGFWSKSYMVLNRLTSRFHLTPTDETKHEPKCTTRITKSRVAPNQMILLLFETSKFHTPSDPSTQTAMRNPAIKVRPSN